MKVFLTARRLKPGAWEDFRRAWEPDEIPAGLTRAYHLRNPNDPDEIISFGLFEDDSAAIAHLRESDAERRRQERMAQHVAEVLAEGVYDVRYELTGRPTGSQTAVPLTQRFLKPGSHDEYQRMMMETFADQDPPPGTVRVLAMTNGDELIQLGIIRSDDLEAGRAAARPGYEQMLRTIEPFIDRVGLDATYELVEELALAPA
ncbi:MAG TPA: hypothetical protein VM823_06875 [Gaiellales bacterium]|nr:hypothetical protein [Gaiellales bacterium]